MLTYLPGLNSFIFGMRGMDWFGWVCVIVSMSIVFSVMEIEKGICRSLKSKGVDTDDRTTLFFTDGSSAPPGAGSMDMPMGTSRLNLQELNH